VAYYEDAVPDCSSAKPKAGHGNKLRHFFKQKGGELSNVAYSATEYLFCMLNSPGNGSEFAFAVVRFYFAFTVFNSKPSFLYFYI